MSVNIKELNQLANISFSKSMLTVQVSDHNLDSQMCLPIGEEYSSQASMRTLVLVMFIFLFVNMATSILCFKSVYYESTIEGWIPSQNAVKIRFLSLEG